LTKNSSTNTRKTLVCFRRILPAAYSFSLVQAFFNKRERFIARRYFKKSITDVDVQITFLAKTSEVK